jgi:K+-sensing histidine kinase KdpD
MASRVVRVALAVLVLVALPVGLWATLAPRSFYDDFPGAGRVWVAVDGPYNEHLVRDVGSLNLALAAVTVVALATLARPAVLAAAAAWILYSLPHLVYHLRHLDVYDTTDTVLTVVALSLALVLPAVVLVAELRRRAHAA